MFLIGLGVGILAGGTFGVMLMAIFQLNKD